MWQRQPRAVKAVLRSSWHIALLSMPSLPVSSGSSAGLAFNKATQAFHQHKAIVASSVTNASSESQHVSMATMFLVALSCIAAVGLLVYLIRCLMSMCSDDTFQKALDADRFVPLSAQFRLILTPFSIGMPIMPATVPSLLPPAKATASFATPICSQSKGNPKGIQRES